MRLRTVFLMIVAVAIGLYMMLGSKKNQNTIDLAMIRIKDPALMTPEDNRLLALDIKFSNIAEALDNYYYSQRQYPDSLERLVPRWLKSEDELTDPWNTRIIMKKGEKLNVKLISAGPDGKYDTGDDYTRSI